ncbi:MAG: UDP-N-acetylmuramoyl-tripeptide--D-alanyl-D-alanine ligase [Lagierella massiliensis]|nr:UDP-N-acetylmuramoyl-tripeptide--D-alanyl-D-alanine ligase [Lagierella massiliensis]
MIERKLFEISRMCDGELYNISHGDIVIKGVSTDSRTVEKGNLFIPIVGENFDGHEFAFDALEKGASAILWEKKRFLPRNDIPVIIVENSFDAMIKLARSYRLSLNCKVIALTGSNGKTTTKDIISGLLKQKYKVQRTQQNFNNEYGLPKTIFSLDEDCEVAVIEMGTEKFGDISLLTDIARPDYAIITNIGDSHLLKLKTKENIARAKLEILEGLDEDGIFLYNYDDPVLRKVVKEFKLPNSTFTYGMHEDCDFVIEPGIADASGTTITIDNHIYTIPLLGQHQMYNGGISIIIAEFFKLDYPTIAKGLTDIDLTGMRNELIHLKTFDILNDSYKSNPQSLEACLKTVYSLKGYDKKIAVIGDMLELGVDEIRIHEDIADELNPSILDYVLTIGNLAKHIHNAALPNLPEDRCFHFDSKEEIIEKLKELITPNTLVMVKASRAMKLEEVVEALLEYGRSK